MNTLSKEEIRRRTYVDVVQKLKKYKKCVLCRPTGFGKTVMLTKLTGEILRDNKKVLYVYPEEVIREDVANRLNQDDIIRTLEIFKCSKNPNIEFMTYAKLARVNQKTVFNQYRLIIFDECHRMGADKTSKGIKMLLSQQNKHCMILGATATPIRGDGVDIINNFFDNIVVSKFTLFDAFKTKMINRPYYCYFEVGTSNFGDRAIEAGWKHYAEMQKYKEDTEEYQEAHKNYVKDKVGERSKYVENAFTAGEVLDEQGRLFVTHVMKSKLAEHCSIQNIPGTIRKYCIEKKLIFKEYPYGKFIVFFHSIGHVDEREAEVKSWFNKAFPEFRVRITKVYTDSADDVKALQNLSYSKGVIDLIFCIDMLNMGYHINDLTGIVMYRATKSNIIYTQQLGRALSSGVERPSIVFDIVDNLHRNDVITEDKGIAKRASFDTSNRGNDKQVQKWFKEFDQSDDKTKIPEDVPKEKVDEYFAKIQDTDDFGNSTGKFHWVKKWWKLTNSVDPKTDFISVDGLATDREIMAKTAAYTIAIKCRMAYEAYVRQLCRKENIEFGIAIQDLEKVITNGDVETFVNTVNDAVADKHIRELLSTWQFSKIEEDKKVIPLRAFAALKGVSVREVLYRLGFKGNNTSIDSIE